MVKLIVVGRKVHLLEPQNNIDIYNILIIIILWYQGVESDRVPSFSKAMEHGKPVTVDSKSTLADGLAVPRVGYNAFATAINLIDKMVSYTRDTYTFHFFLQNPPTAIYMYRLWLRKNGYRWRF